MKKYISSIILLTAAIIWGMAFVAQKAASEIPPFTIGAVRCVFASFFLFPMIAVFDKLGGSDRHIISSRAKIKIDLNRHELIGGALSGFFLFVATSLQQTGLADTDAGKASFITALYVLIVPIYSLILGKRSPATVWISVFIAIIGFYLLCIGDGFYLAPADFIILLCAFVFAMQIMCIDSFMPRCHPIRFSFVQFSTSALLSLVFALIFEREQDFSLILTYLPELLFLGVMSSGIAYTLQIIGQKSTPAPVATIILSLESVFGALSGAIILGERLSAGEYIGCAVVFAAVILAQLDFSAPIGRRNCKKTDNRPEQPIDKQQD